MSAVAFSVTTNLCSGLLIVASDWISNGHWALRISRTKAPHRFLGTAVAAEHFPGLTVESMASRKMATMVARVTRHRADVVAWRFYRMIRRGRLPNLAEYRHGKETVRFRAHYVRRFGLPTLFCSLQRRDFFYAASAKGRSPWLIVAARGLGYGERKAAS